eukprot:14639054-Alexandrium_andersonii.AAC.1
MCIRDRDPTRVLDALIDVHVEVGMFLPPEPVPAPLMGLRLQDVTGSVAIEADPDVQCPFCLDPQEAGEEW